MIKKFESFRNDKAPSEKMEDLMTLHDIFVDIGDDSIKSEYWYISSIIGEKFVHDSRRVVHYSLNGRKYNSYDISYNDGWEIDLIFSWESPKTFQDLITKTIRLIKRAESDGFRFVYESPHDNESSYIYMVGSALQGRVYFHEIFDDIIDRIPKNNMKKGSIYEMVLLFKKY
jgi:hypothetical protein